MSSVLFIWLCGSGAWVNMVSVSYRSFVVLNSMQSDIGASVDSFKHGQKTKLLKDSLRTSAEPMSWKGKFRLMQELHDQFLRCLLLVFDNSEGVILLHFRWTSVEHTTQGRDLGFWFLVMFLQHTEQRCLKESIPGMSFWCSLRLRSGFTVFRKSLLFKFSNGRLVQLGQYQSLVRRWDFEFL